MRQDSRQNEAADKAGFPNGTFCKVSENGTLSTDPHGRILKNTILNILVLVVVCCVIMAAAMQSLANSILLDSLQYYLQHHEIPSAGIRVEVPVSRNGSL